VTKIGRFSSDANKQGIKRRSNEKIKRSPEIEAQQSEQDDKSLNLSRKDPEKGREAAAPSNIKEIQEIQGGQEPPHDGGAINPKDA
jgi:hypothetical protein